MLDLSQLHVQKLADKAKSIQNFDANCSYCGNSLPKFPVRSITCRSCSKKSYVETNPIYDKKVLVSEKEKAVLRSLDNANYQLHKATDRTLNSTGSHDDYWKHLNTSLINPSQSKQSVLDTLYQMFLLACDERNYSLAFERLPAILSLELGIKIQERLEEFGDNVFLTYGRPLFNQHFLQQLVFEDDLPYLKELLTSQNYRDRYEYYYNLAGFDGYIVWQCVKAEYKGHTQFFEYLHKEIITPPNTKKGAEKAPKSLLSKFKSKFFN